jgi:hypothetical protein
MSNKKTPKPSIIDLVFDLIGKTAANTDEIRAVESRVIDVAKLSFKREEEILVKLNEAIAVNDKRETAQTLRDQSNVQSLVNLRESTQKGFDQVRKDVEALLKQIQRLNERVGQVESQVGVGNAAYQHMVGVEARVTKIEKSLGNPAPAPSMPSDHVWVNKKLSGVYDTTTDLESRVQRLEAEAELLNDLREAQSAFLLGRPKAPRP